MQLAHTLEYGLHIVELKINVFLANRHDGLIGNICFSGKFAPYNGTRTFNSTRTALLTR